MPKGLKFAAISALSLSLAGFSAVNARAAGQTYDVTFDNVSTSFYSFNVKFPKIEVKSSSVSKADLEKMFSQDISLADRIKALRAFSATSIIIPVISGNFNTDLFKFESTVSNVKLGNIADGKIGQISYPEATLSLLAGEAKTGLMSASYKIKGLQMNDYNFVHHVRLILDKAGPDDKDMVPLYGSAIVESVNVSSRSEVMGMKTDVQADYGKFSITAGAKVKLLSRPLKDTMADMIALSLAMQKNEKTPENLAKLQSVGLSVIEIFENYQVDSYVAEGMTLSQTSSVPGGSQPMTFVMKVGKFDGSPGSYQLKDITYDFAGQLKLGIGSLSLKGLSLTPFLEMSKKFLANPEQYSEEDLIPLVTSLFANVGTVSVDNLSVRETLPNPKNQVKPAPVAGTEVDFKLKNFTLRSEKPVNGLPSSLRLSVENAQMPVSSLKLDEEGSEVFKQLGYESLNISYAFDMFWNKDKNELVVNEISGSEQNSGSYVIKGIFGNFTQNLFTTDTRIIGRAVSDITVRETSLQVEDKGLFDRAVTAAGKTSGMTLEQTKALYSFALESIPQPLAGTNAVGTIKKALLQYIQKPGKLDISIKSKVPDGVGLRDFMFLSETPMLIDEKISVTATASN